MDITSGFEPLIPGSSPGGRTVEKESEYSLMVERLVANQTAGVRFPLLAPKTQGPDALALWLLCFTAIG